MGDGGRGEAKAGVMSRTGHGELRSDVAGL